MKPEEMNKIFTITSPCALTHREKGKEEKNMWNYHDKWKNHTGNSFLNDYKNVLQYFTTTVNGLICEQGKNTLDIKNLLLYVVNLVEKERYASRGFELLHGVYVMDGDTFVHSLNVALISHEIATWLDFSKEKKELATLCGLLHDVGKMQIDCVLLKKPGALTEKEREIIKQHSMKGFELLLKSEWEIDSHVCNAALQHHERYDGSGYPCGLEGEQIDVYARIVAIADVYDAMTANRVYRDALEPERVLAQMRSDNDKYDPEIFAVFYEKARVLLAC